jgi:hypothetical protein
VNSRTWLGLILIISSYGQVLLPRRLFDDPSFILFGYAFIPANLLAFAMSLFALGVIVLSEGACRRFGGVSLFAYAIATPQRLLRVVLTGAAGGLVLEVIAQWLGKLWFYPYWTTWFYWLTLLPGYAFYWLAIVESYLAAKAVLDHVRRRRSVVATRPSAVPWDALGVGGLACLVGAAFWFWRWAAAHGWSFAVVRPAPQAPPFAWVLLAFLGAWLTLEWLTHRRGTSSFVDSVWRGDWVPPAAVLAGSAVVGPVMEAQNNLHYFWRYTHFPAPEASVAGVQATVLATWPLQYLVFLLVAGVLTPGLAALFWSPARR